MNINKIDNTNFTAGNVYLNIRTYKNSIKCYDAIKKIAQDKNIDIYISKTKETKFLPLDDMYLLIAAKDIPVVERMFFPVGQIHKQGSSCVVLSKKAGREELSTKIFNATIDAISVLEKRLADMKKG